MSLKDSAVFALVPVVYGYQKLYTVIPNSTSGDVTFSRGTTSSRINSGGLIEITPAHFPTVDYKMVDAEIVGCPEQSIQMGRTNFLRSNIDFVAPVYWLTNNVSKVTDANLETPTGAFGCVRFMEGTGGTTDKKITQTVSVVSGRTYSFSVYVKPYNTDTSNKPYDQAVRLRFGSNDAKFDIQTGWSNASSARDAQVQKLPNGWLRVSAKFTANSSSMTCEIWLIKTNQNSFVNNYSGDADRGVMMYGAQLESNPGSSANEPSSLIPTTTTTVTRSKDTNYRTNFFSSYIQEPYALYWEGTIDRLTSGQSPIAVYGTNSTVFSFYLTNENTINVFGRASSGSEVLTSFDFKKRKGDYLKVVAQYISSTEVSLCVNGSYLGQKTRSSVVNNTSMRNISIGYKGYSDNQQRQSCSQALIIPRKLTEAECIEITTSDSFDKTVKEYKYLKA